MNPRFRKFISSYRPYRRLFLFDLGCAFLAAGAALALPLIARDMTQIALDGQAEPLARLAPLAALMAAVIAAQTVANHIVDYYGHLMGAFMEADLRAELFAHYQALPFGFHDQDKTAHQMSRLTNDSFAVSELFHHGPEDLAIALFKFVGAFVLLLAINAEITLLLFLCLPLMAIYVFYFFGRMRRAMHVSRERISDVNAQAEDSLAGVRVAQSFTNEAVEIEKFGRENRRFVESRRALYRAEAFFSSGLLVFTQGLTLAVILLGAAAIADGRIGAADLVMFLMFVAILFDPLQRSVNIVRLIQEGATGFERIMDVLEITPAIQNRPGAVTLEQVRGHIEFDTVSFRYRDDHDAVLRGVSFTIEAGDYVALVGTSGVGKTTLCSLIPRFYDVSAGAVRVDGHDVRDVTLDSLRGSIGIVQQDVYLFAGTVYENIRYGRPEATREDVIAAAKLAYAHEFIMALPQGYETEVGQRGVRLSGGQKQRVSIARALLKDPPIILFDEATSALDAESEEAVQRSLEQMAQQRTLIVIAHRPSTIRRARRVLALTDTGIEERKQVLN